MNLREERGLIIAATCRVSADKAYLSVENFEEVAGCGGQAFIVFKSNTTGKAGGAFEKAYHCFQFN